jgi:hypothetical protein
MLYQFQLANDILVHEHKDFFAAMCKWDCQWYLTIIHNGYDLVPRSTPKLWKGLANWAFFPLYPYVVKILSGITRLSPVVVGVVLNQFIVLLALMVFYRYLKLFVDELNSRFGVVLLAFSPFSVYFSSLYTEALFLLLSLLSFYYMRTNRLILSAICGGFLSATRPIGVMFSLPFFAHQIRHTKLNPKNLLRIMLLSLISISGLLLFMYYLQIHVGDFLAFQHIQKGWGRHGLDTQNPVRQLIKWANDTHNFLFFSISVAMSIYLLVKKHFAEALFNLLCILPGAMTGTMMSEGRFCGTLFTLYFGVVIMARKSNSLKLTLALIFVLFYTSYFLYWMAHAKFLI